MRLIRGAASGLMATIAMTGIMYAGKALGLLHAPPPKQITRNAERKVGAPPSTQPPGTFSVSWVAAHVGFGMAGGVIFALVRPMLPGAGVFRGLLYGTLLWAVSYLKVMPKLGLYPYPSEVSKSQTAVMIAAHEVFGSILAETNRRLSGS